jgi:DNA polymerase III sliding clamp (beta) subunit (PCNA family)
MKLHRTDLLEALGCALLAQKGKSPRAIDTLSMISPKGEGFALQAHGSMLAIEAVGRAEGPVLPFVVQTQQLRDFVAGARGELIEAVLADQYIKLQVGAQSAKVPTLTITPEEMPTLPELPAADSDEWTFRVEYADLTSLIARTIHAASREGGRYAMNALRIKTDGPKLQIAATDGRMLVIDSTAIEETDWAAQSLLPVEAGSAIKAIFQGPATLSCFVSDDGRTFALRGGGRTMIARPIEGQFPRVESVVPKGKLPGFEARRSDLIAAIKFAKGAATIDNMAVKLVPAEGGKLEIWSRGSGAEARELVDADLDSGWVGVTLNPDFALSMLSAVSSDRVRIAGDSKTSPHLIRHLADDSPWVGVLMPITVDT